MMHAPELIALLDMVALAMIVSLVVMIVVVMPM